MKFKTKYFWFVTWPHNRSVTWLCGWLSLILSHHPATFGVHIIYDSGNITFFICQVTTKCFVTLWVGSTHPRPLGSIGIAEVEIKRFWFVTWPRDRCVTWRCRWGFLILSYYPAKFGVHKPCESVNITFFICHVIYWSVLWFCGWSLLILSYQLAKFGVHRPCESRDITFLICHVTTWWCVTWLRSRGSFILSHHGDKFGVHRPCESGDITLFICHMTTISKCHVTLWVGSPHPKSTPC